MDTPISVAVIGTGFGKIVHIPGYLAHPAFSLKAVGSVRKGGGQRIADDLPSVRGYDDWQQLLAEESVDLISIATAPHLHAPVTLAALARGSHVLCEKPMALDASEAGAMTERARSLGRVAVISHEFRYLPARRAFHSYIKDGFIGDPIAVSLTVSQGARSRLEQRPIDWLARAETGGGFLGALGSHLIDYLLWCFGDIAEVQGRLDRHLALRPGAHGPERPTADDGFAVLFTFATGATGTLQLIQSVRHGFGSRLEAYGTKGTLALINDTALTGAQGDEPLQDLPVPAREAGDQDPRLPPFMKLLDDVVSEIAGIPTDVATFEQGLRVQRLLDAIRTSSQDGHRVRIL